MLSSLPRPATSLVAGRAPALVRCGRRTVVPIRAFTSSVISSPRSQPTPQLKVRNSILSHKRLLSTSAATPASVATQAAPNPKAYLESGVIKPREHVDVKKVLVIGSGGLAIGQAGEFDYSGMGTRPLC